MKAVSLNTFLLPVGKPSSKPCVPHTFATTTRRLTRLFIALNSDKPFQNKPTSVPKEVLVNTVLLRWLSVSVFLHFSDQSRILNYFFFRFQVRGEVVNLLKDFVFPLAKASKLKIGLF